MDFSPFSVYVAHDVLGEFELHSVVGLVSPRHLARTPGVMKRSPLSRAKRVVVGSCGIRSLFGAAVFHALPPVLQVLVALA
mgnify:CR=1 FL=1